MQTLVIAVLILIAGLIGALLLCATSLISRARLATTTLRRIEETLLAMNRVRAIDSAIKSAEPSKQSQTSDANGAGFLTLRELKIMPGGGRPGMNSAPVPKGRKPPGTGVPPRLHANPQQAPACESSSDGLAKRDPAVQATYVAPTQESPQASEVQIGLATRIEMPRPRTSHQVPDIALQKGTDEIVQETQRAVTAVAHTVPAVHGELPSRKVNKAVEEFRAALNPSRPHAPPEVSTSKSETSRHPPEATTVESAVGRERFEPLRGGQASEQADEMDATRRKKREQELMMIISSRRRRARAGH